MRRKIIGQDAGIIELVDTIYFHHLRYRGRIHAQLIYIQLVKIVRRTGISISVAIVYSW